MSTRYLAFDIETAKLVPEATTEILAHRPLGIACAAAAFSDSDEARTWYGSPAGRPAAQMSREEVVSMVRDLGAFVRDGYTLLTWNGLAFDFSILAEESGEPEQCAELALGHVDMMFHVVCQLGHFLGLQKAAEGLGLAGKMAGVSGAEAPAMWAAGEHDKVLAYNIQDVRVTLEVARESERLGALLWTTRRGTKGRMDLDGGWRNVAAAQRLPLPDTSWMSDPPKRERFIEWFPAARPTP